MKIQNIYLACFVHRHAVSPRDPTPEIALKIRVHFFGFVLCQLVYLLLLKFLKHCIYVN